jgi:VWFA-related protein
VRTRFASAIPLLGLAGLASAQTGDVSLRWGPWTPPAPERITVQANLVEIGVVVRDARSNPVGGLEAGDFEVLDNGKPQPITHFTELKNPRETRPTVSAGARGAAVKGGGERQPRSIAIWFDDVYLRQYGMAKARAASGDLIRGMAPDDRIGVFSSSGSVTLDLTHDQNALLAAVARLRYDALPGPHELGGCPSFDAYSAYVIYHHIDPEVRAAAIRQAIACNCPGSGPPPDPCVDMQPAVVDGNAGQYLAQFMGRAGDVMDSLKLPIQRLSQAGGSRILLAVSPGFISGDLNLKKSSLIDSALAAHIVINALLPEGLSTSAQVGRRQLFTSALMADVSSATGGRLIQNDNDIAGGARALTDLPEFAYTLAISPPGPADGKTHSLKVALRSRARDRVEARNGYVSTEPSPEKETAQMRIDRAARSDGLIADLPASVRVSAGGAGDGRSTVRVVTQLEAGALRFGGSETRRLQQITFLTVLEKVDGGFLEGKEAVMDIEAGPETWVKMQVEGIRAQTWFSVAPGSYRVRQVVREAVQNRLSASDHPIEVR